MSDAEPSTSAAATASWAAFEQLLGASSLPSLLIDANGLLLAANASAQRWARSPIVGQHSAQLGSEADRLLSGAEVAPMDVDKLEFAPARRGRFRLHLSRFGEAAVLVQWEDHSATVAAAERHRAGEVRYRALVELAPSPLLLLRNGLVLFANDCALSTLGLPLEELLGQRLEQALARSGEARELRRERLADDGAVELVVLAAARLAADGLSADGRAADGPARANRRNLARRGTVVVCDDEARLATLTAGLLEQNGFKAHTAGSVASALGLVSSLAVDVLLVDVHLAGESAGMLLAGLQQRGQRLPVVLTSGYAEEDLAPELRVHPLVRGYLAKPYAVERLVTLLNQQLASA